MQEYKVGGELRGYTKPWGSAGTSTLVYDKKKKLVAVVTSELETWGNETVILAGKYDNEVSQG